MRDAETRFAKSARVAIATGAMTLLAILSFGTPSAPADTVHGPISYEFGQNGKPTSVFSNFAGLAYDQTRNRLYVIGHGAIYGFSNPSPGVMTPLPAPFPILEKVTDIKARLTVDNRSGPTNGNLYYSSGSSLVQGWNPSGEPLPGFQGEEFSTHSYNEGLAIDNDGQFFFGQFSGPQEEVVGIWGAGGGSSPTGEISTAASVHNVSGLAIDPNTDDLWVSGQSYPIIAHYTAASGYTSFTEMPAPGAKSPLAIDASRHVLYVGTGPLTSENRIDAYSTTTGELLDSFDVNVNSVNEIAIQESTGTLFVVGYGGRVKELRPVAVPKPTTGEPIGDATVSGTADPDGTGEITSCFFEFGTATSYGSTQDCDQATPLTTSTPVTATLPGLTAETSYHYRLVLENANGRKFGADKTITPHFVKGLRTDAATGVGRTAATLEAHYEGTNKETHYSFEWGLAGSPYEHSTPDEVEPAGTGTTPLSANISGLSAGATYHYRVVGSNEAGSSTAQEVTFTTSPAVKGVATDPTANVTTTTATLQGTVDPDGFPTTYYFQYGHSTAYGLTTPAPPGLSVGTVASGAKQVGAEVTGLDPGATYHYRIVAVNGFGTTVATDDRTFTTAQAPAVLSFASRNVAAHSAELIARISPNEAKTTYRFEYGTTVAYGSVAPEPAETIEANVAEEPVAVQLTGLEPTTYHFRVVAESKWGTTTTGDQTFNFFPPQCPNAQLRELTGSSYLPDCRAYELVSPVSAGNVSLHPEGPFAPAATTPSRFAFSGSFNGIEDSGEPEVNPSDLYVATRTSSGWITKYVGLPASVASQSSGPPNERFAYERGVRASEDLSRLLVWQPANEFGTYGVRDGTYAPYIRGADGAGLGRLPTNVGQFPGADLDAIEGGFVGDQEISKDFSHYVFSSRNIAFAAGGLTSAPGSVYSDDLETGTVRLISETPQNTPIPQGTGGSEEYIEIAGLSADGSHALMSTKGAGGTTHLYMTVNGTAHYDVSEGQDGLNHAVNYVGMTEDGATVYFTSDEQLTADDHDHSTDLFMWREGASPHVTRVSAGSSGTGNTDECPGTWTTRCGIVPVSTGVTSDNPMAALSGDIYFYSPELLDGSRGTLGERNLYVFRAGHVRFVATFSGSALVNRIQVSPNGDHMALITRTKLTQAPTAGHLEMYTFEPGTGEFLCVSCMTNGEIPRHDVEGSQNGLFMTNDGRTFFSTADALVSQDTDGLRDSYEFVDHRAQLISTGTGDRDEGTGFVGVSANGTDAYFSTLETLVPQDTVGPFLKFYDARSGGGIPFQRVAAPCAAADECHGPASGAPPSLPSTTGAPLGSGGNLRSPHAAHHKKKHRASQHAKHHQKRPHRVTVKGADRG